MTPRTRGSTHWPCSTPSRASRAKRASSWFTRGRCPIGRANTSERRHQQQADHRRGSRAAQSTPARRARSAILRARVRCGMSIICPFQAKAPAPRRACSSKAAMSAIASSASALEGVNSALMTSIWPGMDRDLAAEAHRHALPALAAEAVEVRDVGVDGVDRLHPGRRRGDRAHHARVAGNVEVAARLVARARQPHRGGEVLDAPGQRHRARARRRDLLDVEQALGRLGGDQDQARRAERHALGLLLGVDAGPRRGARPRPGAASAPRSRPAGPRWSPPCRPPRAR